VAGKVTGATASVGAVVVPFIVAMVSGGVSEPLRTTARIPTMVRERKNVERKPERNG
jgi:hypothetical protein